MKGKVIFIEEQTFRGLPFILIVIFTLVAVLAPIYWIFFNQIVLGNPTGDNPLSDVGVLILTFGTTLIVGAILGFIYIHQLKLEIDEGDIRYSFTPYFSTMKMVNRSDLKKAYVRKYSPILEYGGWGMRYGFGKGKAYNIWGNKGLQLEFLDGKKLLIGTQKSAELHGVIEKWMNEKGNG